MLGKSEPPAVMSSNLETMATTSPGDEERFCRICFESESSAGFLGSFCRCQGTVGMIHAQCLTRWLETSQRITCELCLERFLVPRVETLAEEDLVAFKVDLSIVDHPGELAVWLMAHLLTTVIFVCMAIESGVRAVVESRNGSRTVSITIAIKIGLALLLLMISFFILYKGAWRAYVVCWAVFTGSRFGQEENNPL